MIDLLAKKFGDRAVLAYLESSEMQRTIPHDLIRKVDSTVVPVTFFCLIALGLFAASRGMRENAAFAAFVLFAVLENTLLCTAVSGVHDRYQARVTWLLPMAVFVIGLSTTQYIWRRREGCNR
jgi:FtsH-binding integral membrane protein